MNHKRVHRVYREAGLMIRRKKRKHCVREGKPLLAHPFKPNPVRLPHLSRFRKVGWPVGPALGLVYLRLPHPFGFALGRPFALFKGWALRRSGNVHPSSFFSLEPNIPL